MYYFFWNSEEEWKQWKELNEIKSSIWFKQIIRKVYSLFKRDINNSPVWLLSLLLFLSTLAIIIAEELIQQQLPGCLSGVLDTLKWILPPAIATNVLDTLKWILPPAIAIYALFLFLNFFDRLKRLRLWFFFIVSFLCLQYWHDYVSPILPLDLASKASDSEVSNAFISIFQGIAIILLLTLLYLFFRWLSSTTGIIILPFRDERNQEAEKKSEEKESQAIAKLLAAELHQIWHIYHLYHQFEREQFKTTPHSALSAICRGMISLPPLGANKGEELQKILAAEGGTISVTSGVSIPLGMFLLSLQQLWPQGTVKIITGSIQKWDGKLQITARCEYSNKHTSVHAYQVNPDNQASDNTVIPTMVKKIAYQIALDLSPETAPTSNWKAFQHFTETLKHLYNNYERHYDETDLLLQELKQVHEYCKQARRHDRNYREVGDLLSLIGFHYLNEDQWELAETVLEEALEVNPRSSYVYSYYGHLYFYQADYKIALRHYLHAQNLQKEWHETYIGIGVLKMIEGGEKSYFEARRNLLKSLFYECENNHAAHSALAWLDFLCYLKALEDGYDEKASSFFKNAYWRLDRMTPQEKTALDYSNLAIFLFYSGGEEDINKAYDNWWRASQVAPRRRTPSNHLRHIFYQLLIDSQLSGHQDIIMSRFRELEDLLGLEGRVSHAMVDDMLKDAKIIWTACIERTSQEMERKLLKAIRSTSNIFYTAVQEVEVLLSDFSILDLEIQSIQLLDPQIRVACSPSHKHRVLESTLRRFIMLLEQWQTASSSRL